MKPMFLLFICVMCLSGLILANGTQAAVKVTMQSGETVTFEYDTFTLDWIVPWQIEEPMSCRITAFSMEDIREIYFAGKFYNICHGRDDWQVTVFLKDDIVYRGFLYVFDFIVKGKLVKTAEEKTIPFRDLKRIRFTK